MTVHQILIKLLGGLTCSHGRKNPKSYFGLGLGFVDNLVNYQVISD